MPAMTTPIIRTRPHLGKNIIDAAMPSRQRRDDTQVTGRLVLPLYPLHNLFGTDCRDDATRAIQAPVATQP